MQKTLKFGGAPDPFFGAPGYFDGTDASLLAQDKLGPLKAPYKKEEDGTKPSLEDADIPFLLELEDAFLNKEF